MLQPAPTRPPRLAPLAKLPVFLDLRDRHVVVVGGGEPAVWKTELLLAAGAQVDLFAPDPHEQLHHLAAGGRLALHARAWRESDLDGAALVVAELDTRDEADALRAAAHGRGLLVNVIDTPESCDFQFGAIVNRSPVVVGIMTDGAAPILGQAIRRRIEAVLPTGLGAWADVAKRFRARLAAMLPGRAERRVFWERFVDVALGTKASPEAEATLERLAADIASGSLSESGGGGRRGEVVIVGAGPGDPELLTLKAMRELQAADIVVYDRLVTPAVLELARREAERIHVGKEGHGAACRQEDISALVVDLALSGNRVVRLKGGDPAIFGRTGEEVQACRAAGVAVRIVPGVTTASAAAASLGTSLTHRAHARKVVFATGHDRKGGLPADLDFAALAAPGTTVAVYMGRRTGSRFAAALLARGLSPGTPVIAMSDVSRPGEAVLRADLAGLADGLDLPHDRPLILLIGAALGLDDTVPATGRMAATLS